MGALGGLRERAKITCVSGVSRLANTVAAICVVCHDSCPAVAAPRSAPALTPAPCSHDHEDFYME